MDQSSLKEYKGGGGGRQLTANKGRGDHKNTPEPSEGGGGGGESGKFYCKTSKTLGSPKSP